MGMRQPHPDCITASSKWWRLSVCLSPKSQDGGQRALCYHDSHLDFLKTFLLPTRHCSIQWTSKSLPTPLNVVLTKFQVKPMIPEWRVIHWINQYYFSTKFWQNTFHSQCWISSASIYFIYILPYLFSRVLKYIKFQHTSCWARLNDCLLNELSSHSTLNQPH